MNASNTDLISSKDNVTEGEQSKTQSKSNVQDLDPISVLKEFRLTVEPVLGLMTLANSISGPVVTNFFEFEACQMVSNGNAAECSNMSSKIESKVQTITADLLMWKSLLESLLPAVISLFIGPWSDVNGRKFLFLASMFGFFGYHVVLAIMSIVPSMPIYYYLFASLPNALTGGEAIVRVAAFCYIADITSLESRTFRMGIMEVGVPIGYGLGNFLSPQLYRFGFPYVFGACAVVNFTCLLYIYLCLQETIIPERGVRYNVFNWQHVYEIITTTFFKRPKNRACIVFLLLLIFLIHYVIYAGESSVMFLWLKLQFRWTLSDFTTYRVFSMTIKALGATACLWVFSFKLQLPNLLLATVITALRDISCVIFAFAFSSWQIYAADCVGMFYPALASLLRGTISKITPNNEIGKVFALIAASEATAPLVAAPLYTFIYKLMIHTVASNIFLLSAFLYTLIMACVIITVMIQWRFPAAEHSPQNDTTVEAPCQERY